VLRWIRRLPHVLVAEVVVANEKGAGQRRGAGAAKEPATAMEARAISAETAVVAFTETTSRLLCSKMAARRLRRVAGTIRRRHRLRQPLLKRLLRHLRQCRREGSGRLRNARLEGIRTWQVGNMTWRCNLTPGLSSLTHQDRSRMCTTQIAPLRCATLKGTKRPKTTHFRASDLIRDTGRPTPG